MSPTRKVLLLLTDVFALYAALFLTLVLRYGKSELADRWDDHLLPFSLIFLAWLLIFELFDLYRQKSLVNYNALANRLILACSTAVLASIVLFYLFNPFFELTPKRNLFIFAGVFALLDYLFRAFFRKAAAARPSPAILIGDSPRTKELAEFLDQNPHAGYKVAEWLHDFSSKDLLALAGRIQETGAHTLIIEPRLAREPQVVKDLYRLLPLGIAIFNFSDFYELMFERVPLEDLEEAWFIEHVVTRRPFYDRVKRVVDIFLSFILLVLFSPLAILIHILIPLTSQGPAIFRQKRVGKNDREFTLYKFRTMNTISGGNDGTPAWTVENDPRITGFGKFLRASHLDEIPQLWNILKGDISFTGPRAERIELAKEFAAFPYYEIRHVVQPGLTGWAQINYRPSASLEEAKTKLAYDVYYVKNRSFLLDLAITLKTIKYFFTAGG
jgi:exopolysaccharide biosynthesis polyprenyl glycosylphosphotransferase